MALISSCLKIPLVEIIHKDSVLCCIVFMAFVGKFVWKDKFWCLYDYESVVPWVSLKSLADWTLDLIKEKNQFLLLNAIYVKFDSMGLMNRKWCLLNDLPCQDCRIWLNDEIFNAIFADCWINNFWSSAIEWGFCFC